MSEKLIFLSHITEEKELAKIIKDAIEDEFSGFVEVFVSSDGNTIKAGQNFLNVIENGLVNCIAAIYLISPESVRRSWISFELGAVWVRNAISQKNGGPEIPAIPFCHSDMIFSDLPQPICNLNGIEANRSHSLEFAFKSIQTAVGGRGRLRTDFDVLAEKINSFERDYTVFKRIGETLNLIGVNDERRAQLVQLVNSTAENNVTIKTNVRQDSADQIFKLVNTKLSHFAKYKVTSSGLGMGPQGASPFCEIELIMDRKILSDYLAR
ncbi:toll/interleukin-1 receptor domain-containing protein [Klebsiella aerogenes]|mgnify:CR=1 FL=1|uniref:toll/interleukin-1 receptor domain-containing protein n=1 Tax=Klebsiella aerogenes TaxID=548 RepID=UPI0027EF048E|nr:toll/interleukin-1 receptor domain-containing protein [Klebsiella aerogenes]EKZ5663309.1 toll/interleukin-1 receptor domain-containing protein [Klebsiella aerogenes]MDU6965964.1 toll/interleukin-1 receptor domain-containing protein [Klebsiella aerogenes]HDU4307297.1 toll/interleukin-1 receptor domain-containing protein [Klebsiella aerogenes]